MSNRPLAPVSTSMLPGALTVCACFYLITTDTASMASPSAEVKNTPPASIQKQNSEAVESLLEKARAFSKAGKYIDAVNTLSQAINLGQKSFDLSIYQRECAQSGWSQTYGPYVESLKELAQTHRYHGWNGPTTEYKAVPYQEKVLAISEASYPSDHPEVLGALRELADDYRHAGQYSKAIATCQKWLDHTKMLKEKLAHWPKDCNYQPDKCEHLWALMVLSNVYLDMDDDHSQESVLTLELKEEEEMFGKDSHYVADILERYADVLKHDGKLMEAKPLEERAKKIRLATHTKAEHRVQAVLLKSR